MIKIVSHIFLNSLPVILMVGLIPLVSGDIALTVIYCGIIGVAFGIRYEKHDSIFLIFGFVVLTISELFFVSTGVEIFTRTSLFGLIPLWLPFLWAYAFVAIKRSIIILDNNLES